MCGRDWGSNFVEWVRDVVFVKDLLVIGESGDFDNGERWMMSCRYLE